MAGFPHAVVEIGFIDTEILPQFLYTLYIFWFLGFVSQSSQLFDSGHVPRAIQKINFPLFFIL